MGRPPRAFVAVLVIHLHFPDAGSLKARRRELAPVKAHLINRVGATVSEVGGHDTWQRAVLVAALTADSPGRLQASTDTFEGWLDSRFPGGARVERTIRSVQDLVD